MRVEVNPRAVRLRSELRSDVVRVWGLGPERVVGMKGNVVPVGASTGIPCLACCDGALVLRYAGRLKCPECGYEESIFR